MLRTPDPDGAAIVAHHPGNGKGLSATTVEALTALSRALRILCLTSIAGAAGADPADLTLTPGNLVAGQYLAWYAQDWWQWAFSMPTDQSPIRDDNGRLCGVNQGGPVWYLAGGFGSARIRRACVVPAGRFIFFPIINTVVTTMPGQTRTCEEVRAEATQNNDRYVHLMVEVDGVRIPDLKRTRIAPETCFDLAGRAPSAVEPRPFYPSATDGFWVMLAPLSPGDHRIEFPAFTTNPDTPGGDAVQNISYDIRIQGAP